MRLRTLGAVCAACAITAPCTAYAADSPAPAPNTAVAALAAPGVPATVPGDPHAGALRLLADRHVWMKRRHVRLLGETLARDERSELRTSLLLQTPKRVRAKTHALARQIRELRRRVTSRYGGAPDVSIPAALRRALNAIAQCESGGDPRAISASGMYRGKYQFSFATWRTVGGRGDPAQASEIEQDRRAAMLYKRDGPGQWPVCGR